MCCRFYIVYVVWLAIETTIIFFVYPVSAVSSHTRV